MNENKNKRIETFVFEFNNQEVFKDFFEKYFHALSVCGMTCLGASSQNLITENDKLLDLIGQLYDVVANNISNARKDEILEKAEKLLGIK